MSKPLTPARGHAVHPQLHQSHTTQDHTEPQHSRPLASLPIVTNEHGETVRAADLPNPIMDDDDETASDSAEPVTPPNEPSYAPFLKDAATPKAPTVKSKHEPLQKEPVPSSSPSPLKLRTKVKSIFRRNHASKDRSGSSTPADVKPTGNGFTLSRRKNHEPSPRDRSPTSSQLNSPASPSSPTSTVNGGYPLLGTSPLTEESFSKPTRASTGLSLRVKGKVAFGLTPQPPERRIRSPSLSDVRNQPARPGFSRPAETGAGLKSRRLSASLPDDFTVDSCELSEEFVSASLIPGKRGKEIGRGATATVKIMYRKGGSKDVRYAVKEFRKMSQKENADEYEKKVKSEFSIANSLHHPNIVKTVRLCTHNGRWNHVMEYCSYGELFTLLQKGYLQPKDKMCFFKQIVRGVAYLHENGIAHRDIKLENLLLSDEGYVKITDFGVSEVFSGIHPGLRSSGGKCGQEMKEVRLSSPGICGSLPYIAPEVLAKKGSYDPRPLDVWSCAIVYLTLHFGGNLWPAADLKYDNYAAFSRGWDRFLEKNPEGVISDDSYPSCGPAFRALTNVSMKRLVLRMLHPDPSRRITIHDVLNDRHYKSIECCAPDHFEDYAIDVTCIDAAGKGSCRAANKMPVRRTHNHFPPEKKIPSILQHRFDMGPGQ
ncbi:hypothetical protein VTO42DRAFT_5571 [Malbranchea cinnamomea]